MIATAVDGGTRARILSAAVDLFGQQGYDGTSVNQVIERAGVAKGGFYHHFASKESLLYEVYGDLITRQLAELDEILARGLAPAQTLRAAIDALVVSTAVSSAQALVFFREQGRLGGQRTVEYRAARRRCHDLILELIRRGQRDGAFAAVASAEMVTFTVFGVINELPIWYRPEGRQRPEQLARELSDLILAALAMR
jgi:AcrR family transcriptional regulator